MENNSKHGLAIGLMIVGLVIGGFIGYGVNAMSDEGNGNSASVSEVDKATSDGATARVGLNNALREHVSLASGALRASFDGDKDAAAAVASLDENSVEVAGIIGKFYGEEAEETFLKVWRDHIGFFADYTVAAKAGDAEAMKQAKAELAGYTETASAFLSEANPNLEKDVLKENLTHHLEDVIDIVDAYGAGDYEKSYALEQEAREHMNTTADTLGVATLKLQADK